MRDPRTYESRKINWTEEYISGNIVACIVIKLVLLGPLYQNEMLENILIFLKI